MMGNDARSIGMLWFVVLAITGCGGATAPDAETTDPARPEAGPVDVGPKLDAAAPRDDAGSGRAPDAEAGGETDARITGSCYAPSTLCQSNDCCEPLVCKNEGMALVCSPSGRCD